MKERLGEVDDEGEVCRRSLPKAERIAERIEGLAEDAEPAEGVVRLNPGFFKLERLRAGAAVKRRSDQRDKVSG